MIDGMIVSDTCKFPTTVGKDPAKIEAIRERTPHICFYQPSWRTKSFTGLLKEVHKAPLEDIQRSLRY